MEETLARIFQFTVAVSVAFAIALWFALAVWAYRDITRRTESASVQIAATLLVALGFIPGAVVYLLLRPRETLDERRQRIVEESYLEQELANLIACPECDTLVRDEFVYCPTCGNQLREICPDCGKTVDLGWQVCAYCGAELEAHASSGAQATKRLTAEAASTNADQQREAWEVDVDHDDGPAVPAVDREPSPAESSRSQSPRRPATEEA